MNINDFSDNTVTLHEKPARKNKRLIIIVIILLVLAVTAVACWFIFKGRSDKAKEEEIYKKYVEPIITNDKLIAEKPNPFGETMYSYKPPEGGMSYQATYAPNDKIIQVQLIQSVVLDENFRPINDHFLNLLYIYHYGTDEAEYRLHITEISDPGDQEGKSQKKMYIQDGTAQIELDTELNYIRGMGQKLITDEDGLDLSEDEVRAIYEKYKDDVVALRGKMYALFGEENFKK